METIKKRFTVKNEFGEADGCLTETSVVEYRSDPAKTELEKKLQQSNLERVAVQKNIISASRKRKEAKTKFEKTYRMQRKLYHKMQILRKTQRQCANETAMFSKKRKELNNVIELQNDLLEQKNKKDSEVFQKTAKKLSFLETEMAQFKNTFKNECVTHRLDPISPAKIGHRLKAFEADNLKLAGEIQDLYGQLADYHSKSERGPDVWRPFSPMPEHDCLQMCPLTTAANDANAVAYADSAATLSTTPPPETQHPLRATETEQTSLPPTPTLTLEPQLEPQLSPLPPPQREKAAQSSPMPPSTRPLPSASPPPQPASPPPPVLAPPSPQPLSTDCETQLMPPHLENQLLPSISKVLATAQAPAQTSALKSAFSIDILSESCKQIWPATAQPPVTEINESSVPLFVNNVPAATLAEDNSLLEFAMRNNKIPEQDIPNGQYEAVYGANYGQLPQLNSNNDADSNDEDGNDGDIDVDDDDDDDDDDGDADDDSKRSSSLSALRPQPCRWDLENQHAPQKIISKAGVKNCEEEFNKNAKYFAEQAIQNERHKNGEHDNDNRANAAKDTRRSALENETTDKATPAGKVAKVPPAFVFTVVRVDCNFFLQQTVFK